MPRKRHEDREEVEYCALGQWDAYVSLSDRSQKYQEQHGVYQEDGTIVHRPGGLQLLAY